ncbi:MAG: MFS transporter [Synergistes sp.]|nr:MFS transporter [Synergistes sp.]
MKYFFLVVLLVAYFMSNLMRVSGVVVLPPLAESMGLSAAAIAFLSSLFFYTYGASYGLWGVLVDERGSFTCCGISLMIAAAGCLTMGISSTEFAIGAGRALCGLGMASAFTGILMYCAYAFSRENYPLMVGVCLVIGHSGTVAAVAPLGWALDLLGARGVFFALAVTAFVLGAILLFYKKYDPRLAKGEVHGRLKFKEVTTDLFDAAALSWKKYPLRVVVLTWATTAAAIAALQGLWAVSWIECTTSVSLSEARICATFISIGLVAGPAAGGFIFKRCPRSYEKKTFLWCCILNQLSWLLWMASPHFPNAVTLFAISGFAVGFFNGVGYVFTGNAIRTLAPLDKNAAIIGVTNMILYLGVIVFQWGTGAVLDLFPSGTAGYYKEEGFLLGFALILIIQGLSFYMITKVKKFY